MKTTPTSRSKFPKNSKPIPRALRGAGLCLPADVNLSEMDWFRVPQPISSCGEAHPAALSAEQYEEWASGGRKPKGTKPAAAAEGRRTLPTSEIDRLIADPRALRKFLAETQRKIESFEPWREQFAELRGALGGNAQ